MKRFFAVHHGIVPSCFKQKQQGNVFLKDYSPHLHPPPVGEEIIKLFTVYYKPGRIQCTLVCPIDSSSA